MCLQNAGKLAKRYMPDITSMLKHTDACKYTNTEWLLFLPYIAPGVGVPHYRRLRFLNAASVPHTDTMLCREALETHSHTHTDAPLTLAWMPARVLGAKKCAP